jgi:hypothetical protein
MSDKINQSYNLVSHREISKRVVDVEIVMEFARAGDDKGLFEYVNEMCYTPCQWIREHLTLDERGEI